MSPATGRDDHVYRRGQGPPRETLTVTTVDMTTERQTNYQT